MGLVLSFFIVAGLLAFNIFAADTMVRMHRDIKEIHKAVVVRAPPPGVRAPSNVGGPDAKRADAKSM